LPDKSVSLLDTACARVAISQFAIPASVDDSRRRIQALDTEKEIILRETAVGLEHQERLQEIDEALEQEKQKLATLEDQWNQEKDLVNSLLDLRGQLREIPDGTIEQAQDDSQEESPAAPAEEAIPEQKKDRQELLDQLKTLQEQLVEIQKENPLILPSVDGQAVASVVADWTGIPVGRMVKNEIEAVLTLADTMEKRVVGQRHALTAIARRIRTSRAGLDNPNRPIGVFMLVGPSGVGKTETALTLAEALYGGEHNVITINMSEFQEAHTVSTLKGAPPGYVGYGEGGILTEAVRRRPYSVVLLDEVEKAHPDVHEIFFQVFDKGMMEDGEGRMIDFKNTIILLTSNAGSDLIMNMCKDPALLPEPEGIVKSLRESLRKVFPAALLGRLVVVPYYPINDEMLDLIIRLQLGRIEKRLMENQKIPFTYTEEVTKLIAARCTEVESGGRMVDAILTHTLLPAISKEFLNCLVEGGEIQKVHVSVENSDFKYDFN
jgi:type VI secretion system protein VasG